MILTYPVKMQPLYLVWEIDVLTTENKSKRKEREREIIATSNPNETLTKGILAGHASPGPQCCPSEGEQFRE